MAKKTAAQGGDAAPRRTGVASAVVLVVAAAIPTAAFQLPRLLPAVDEEWFIGGGLLALVVLVALSIRSARQKARDEAAEASAVDDYRITMKRALVPITVRLSEMVGLSPARRREHLMRVSDRAAVSLADYLLRHVPDVRATVYWIDEHATMLFPVAHAGAGDPPGRFVRGEAASDANLEWVVAGGRPRRVGDHSTGPGGDPSAPYRSYVSVVIRAGADAYGMVTVDSPVLDAFTSTDEETVSVIAALLATACAMAYPDESRPVPGD